MRWYILGLVLAASVLCKAEKRVSVAQLEQALSAAAGQHKTDHDLVHQIDGMELTERLSEAKLERLEAEIHADADVEGALRLLADTSEFLDLPADEMPADSAPDLAAQLRMFDAAERYVAETLVRLPNFLATRTTDHFDDSPQELKKGAWPVRAGLHLVNQTSRESSVIAERENQTRADDAETPVESSGLTSWGEFGSVLGMVLADATNGKVNWSHWEQMAEGRTAVFHFSVPKPVSHFEVVSPMPKQLAVEGFASQMAGGRGVAGIAAKPGGMQNHAAEPRDKRAYQGSLWVDPETGAILRITITADSKGSSAFQRADMLVEYAPVEIGGAKFICPVRSLALSSTLISAADSTGNMPSEWLNETLFSGYHRFASTTKILTGNPITH